MIGALVCRLDVKARLEKPAEPVTAAKRCLLVCYDGGIESECPDDMGCYRYPNSPIGYCLYL